EGRADDLVTATDSRSHECEVQRARAVADGNRMPGADEAGHRGLELFDTGALRQPAGANHVSGRGHLIIAQRRSRDRDHLAATMVAGVNVAYHIASSCSPSRMPVRASKPMASRACAVDAWRRVTPFTLRASRYAGSRFGRPASSHIRRHSCMRLVSVPEPTFRTSSVASDT